MSKVATNPTKFEECEEEEVPFTFVKSKRNRNRKSYLPNPEVTVKLNQHHLDVVDEPLILR